MDVLKSYLNGNKQELLIFGIALEAVFVFAFVICSFVVAGTANAGFNCVLTGLLNSAYIGGCYHVVKSSKAPIAIGFLIGSSAMMTFLNLNTAIYWGQLSNCDTSLDGKVPQYSCSNPTAYGAVSAFASLLFVVQIVFTASLVLFRGELISEAGVYDAVATNDSQSFSYSAPINQKLPPSADL